MTDATHIANEQFYKVAGRHIFRWSEFYAKWIKSTVNPSDLMPIEKARGMRKRVGR